MAVKPARIAVATTDISVDDSRPFFSGLWTGDYRDWQGDIGIGFVAHLTFTITAFGVYAPEGSPPFEEPCELTLWDAASEQPLVHKSITSASPLEGHYAWETLEPPFTVRAGRAVRLTRRCIGRRWLDSRASIEQLDDQVASGYAQFTGGVYNFHFGYPSFSDGPFRRAGTLNFKIAPELTSVAIDKSTPVGNLQGHIEEVTGIIPLQQRVLPVNLSGDGGGGGDAAGVSVARGSARCTTEYKVLDGRDVPLAATGDGELFTVSVIPGALALTASSDGTARLWATAENVSEETTIGGDGRCLQTFSGHGGPVTFADFSLSAALAVTASSDHTARLWCVERGHCVHSFVGHSDTVRMASFSSSYISPHGFMILTCSDDHTARLWSVETGVCIFQLRGHTGGVTAAVFSTDGFQVVTASQDGKAKVWSSERGEYLWTLNGHGGPVVAIAFSPSTPQLLTLSVAVSAPLMVWDAETGDALLAIGAGAQVRSASFSPDGSLIATASSDHTARLWDVGNCGDCRHVLSHGLQVIAVTFSPDGGTLATCGGDHAVRVWRVDTGLCVQVCEGHIRSVSSVSFSPDGMRVISSSADCTARVFSVTTGACLEVLKGHSAEVVRVMFSS
eukprot:TRINITY_DN35250_c0_g1_i1.p1 TRINITY_DN35250_c0_g1~~TRINITY_DN35250_c0_g1_i1.p1  ORF type:complete len:619 (-),score=76.95 TRINITY_DN35250_c0_g1_i1:120-1976(-)